MPQNDDTDLTPLLDASQTQVELTISAGDTIETKALGILAADIALLIFLAQDHLATVWSWFSLSALLLVVSAAYTIAAIWPVNYSGAVVDIHERPDYLTMPRTELVLQLIANTQTAIDDNDAINQRRLSACIHAIIFGLAATTVLVFAILMA